MTPVAVTTAVDPVEFLAVVATAAVAGTVSVVLTGRGLLVPTVVVELVPAC